MPTRAAIAAMRMAWNSGVAAIAIAPTDSKNASKPVESRLSRAYSTPLLGQTNGNIPHIITYYT
jgi:hypothetical protein